jgi:rhodanese-related sulfurtransferase
MRKITIIGIVMLLIVVSLSGCLETSQHNENINIYSFQVSPSIIEAGKTANLSWNVENADTVIIDNGIGSVALTGTRIVSPTINTTYTLTATKSGASKNATAQIILTEPPEPEQSVSVKNISPENAYYMILNWTCPCLHIVDVRTAEEYARGHINISKINPIVNLTNIDYRAQDHMQLLFNYDLKVNVLGPKNDTYLLYCKAGARSAAFAQEMVDAGFKNVYNMDGGYDAWNSSGLPTIL